MKEKEYADKTGVERSLERWEGEGGEVLPTTLRLIELAAIEKQENKDDGEQSASEEKVTGKIVKHRKKVWMNRI